MTSIARNRYEKFPITHTVHVSHAEREMAEDDDGGLFGIDLDSSGEESESKAQDKVPRDFQSEDDFLLIKDTYMAKIELGEVQSFFLHLLFAPPRSVLLELLNHRNCVYRRYQANVGTDLEDCQSTDR